MARKKPTLHSYLTNPELSGFVTSLRANPDDATRLIFADWLDERGEAESANFIRLQVECAALAEEDRSEKAERIRKRHRAAVGEREEQLCRILGVPKEMEGAVECTFRGGFLDSLFVPVQWLLDGAEALEPHALLLRDLAVGRVNGWGERLARCPLLRHLTDLDVRAWISSADAQAIAASPYLRQLQALQIWLGNTESSDTVTSLAFAGGATKAYPNLRELRIVDVPGCTAKKVAEMNAMIGRPIASAVLPYPRLFPIDANFSPDLFAGHLPDGTQVLVDAGDPEEPLRVFCFTPEGRQTEIRHVPFRAEWESESDFKDYLIREWGFTPGRIDVLGLDDPTGSYSIEEGYDEDFGRPDDPDVRPEDDPRSDDALGYAQTSSYWLEYGAYVFHCEGRWYVGPDGTVEST